MILCILPVMSDISITPFLIHCIHGQWSYCWASVVIHL